MSVDFKGSTKNLRAVHSRRKLFFYVNEIVVIKDDVGRTVSAIFISRVLKFQFRPCEVFKKIAEMLERNVCLVGLLECLHLVVSLVIMIENLI